MGNQSFNELIEKYKLSKEEHNMVLETLKKELFEDKKIEANPSIMFVVGQPGCGKTTFINSIDLSDYTVINSDLYRSFNRYSKEILEKYPTDYAKLTNFDAHLWGDELFLYAIQNGYSVLREKAPTDDSILKILKTAPTHYKIVINVVVAGNLSSILATRERYEKEILESNHAKLSNIESHNKCYNLLPDFILKCLSLSVKVNYVIPVNGQFKIVPVGENPFVLLEKLREESNARTQLDYDKRMESIRESMINRNAPKKQFEELKKIEDIYFEVSNNGIYKR